MKRTSIIAFLMIFCSVLSYGQQSYFGKFADMDGVTSVYISKSLNEKTPAPLPKKRMHMPRKH